MSTRSTSVLWLVLLPVAVAGLYAACLNPAGFGYYHDDAMYVVCAKSLATGQGYRIISLPQALWQTKFPPLYPFLLSLVWRLYPEFPANVVPMMGLSVLITGAFFGLMFRYLTAWDYAGRALALAMVALSALHLKILLIGSGLYSEMLFALLSLLTLQQLECAAAPDPPSLKRGWVAGLFLGMLIVTRTAGVALLIAAVFYLGYRRRWRQIPCVAVPAGLFLLVWLAWGYTHRPPATGPSAAYLSWYTNYFSDFYYLVPDGRTFLRVLGSNLFSFLFFVPMTVFNLTLAQVVSSSFLQALVLGGSFVMLFGWALENWKGLRLLSVYVVVYLAFLCAYPYLVDRYLLPVLPFLWLYLLRGLQPLARLTRRGPWAGWPRALPRIAAGMILLSFASLVWTYPVGLRSVFHRIAAARVQLEQDSAVQEWIRRHTRAADVLVCYQDPLYYLHTGRRAIRSWDRARARAMPVYDGNGTLGRPSADLLDVIRELGGTYLIVTERDFSQESDPERLRAALKARLARAPEIFTPIYQSPGRFATVYRIAPAP